MNPQDLGIFAQTLRSLQDALLPGMTLLRPVLLALMGLLVFVETITMCGAILWLRASIPASVLRLVLRTSVLVAVLFGAPAVVTGLVDGFTQLGLLAGNNRITTAQFMDAGNWLSMGFRAGMPLLTAWEHTGVFTVVHGMVYLIGWALMILAFAYMGFSLFVLQLQMSLTLVGAQVLLPFAANRFTSWIAQGAVAYPINVAFRFLFKALLASLVYIILEQRAQAAQNLATSATMVQQIQAIVVMLILPLVFAVLFWKSDAIASGLLQGVPGLSVGNFLGAAAGGVALATGAGGLAVLGGRMAGSMAGMATRGITAATTAYQMGSATTIGGTAAQIAGGMRGLALAAGNTAGRTLSGMVSPSMQALRQNIQQGRRAGFVATGGTLPASLTQQPTMARPEAGFNAQLQQTLRNGAYFFGNDQGHGGVTPHF